MKKILLLFLIVIFCISCVSAYEINDTLRINAEYKINGVFTSSNASISIFLPSSIIDINNVTMNNSGIGNFFYDYDIGNKEGEYDVIIYYYNSTDSLGHEESVFVVGSDNNIRFGVCPSGTNGFNFMIVILVVLILLGIVGFIYKSPGILLTSAVLLMFMSLVTWGCGQFVGIFTIVCGVLFLITAGAVDGK